MSEYFDKAIPGLFSAAVHGLHQAINKQKDEFTRSGSNGLSNSRFPIYVQDDCFEAVRAYSEALLNRLEQFAHDDRVVDAGDYDTAVRSLREFSAKAEEIYEDIRKQGEPFNDRRPPMDKAKMQSVVASAANDIREHKAVLTTRQSFKKWLMSDLRKVGLAPTVVALLAGLIGALLATWLGLR